MTNQERQVLQFESAFRMILDGMNVKGLDITSLMAITLAQADLALIEPDENKRIMIASMAIDEIKQGKSPVLEYDEKHNGIRKRKLEGVTVRIIKNPS